MNLSEIATGLASQPLAWCLALALGALVYLFKTLDSERKAHASELLDSQTKLIESIRADAKEQREILSQIVPLSTRLTEGLEILERVMHSATKE